MASTTIRNGFYWEVSPYQTFPELTENYAQAVFQAGRRVADEKAKSMELWMKSNAPWTDRTGRARATLSAVVSDSGLYTSEIKISHGVSYGVWLEVAHGGKYAIISRTVDQFGAELWAGIRGLMNLGYIAS